MIRRKLKAKTAQTEKVRKKTVRKIKKTLRKNINAESVEKKKMVIATDNFPPRLDGISRFLIEVIPYLSRSFDITVLCPDFGDTSEVEKMLVQKASDLYPQINTEAKPFSLKVIKIKTNKFMIGDYNSARFAPLKVRKAVKNANIVFTQTIGPIGALSLILSRQNQIPIAAYSHSVEWDLVPKAAKNSANKYLSFNVVKGISKFLYNKATVIIVPSHNHADMLNWHRIVSPTSVVNLGCDPDVFKYHDATEMRSKLGFSAENIVFGYHGRLSREKDPITLLRAFNRVQKQVPAARLLILGSGLKEIETVLAKKEGVVVVPAQKDVVPYLNAMDIYVMPSLSETTCLSLLEAMSCKRPVITTKVGYINEYIIEGKNGLFFEKQNSFDLSKKMLILIKDHKMRESLASNARETVEKNFVWKKTGLEIEKVLVNLEKGKIEGVTGN